MDIQDYWRVHDQIKARYGKHSYKHIDYCGLVPIRPMKREEYGCTPHNTLSFATTAGDGVHFGFMGDPATDINDGPVVMTVPMAKNNNIIVAESFAEFLAIGIQIGWFGLEQLAYDLDSTISDYEQPDPDMSSEARLFLEMIQQEMPIAFTPLSKIRLAELHDRYFHQLIINDEVFIDPKWLTPKHQKMLSDFFEREAKKKI